MGVETAVIVAAVAAVGLLFAARALIKAPKGANNNKFGDDAPGARATRGTIIPVLIGKGKVPSVIGAVGNQKTKKVSSSGGKGGGGGGGTKKTVYYEDAWDILTYGACSKLFEIRFNNKVIWTGPIDAQTTPSGTEVDAGKWGSFVVYWGEADQPINELLPLLDNNIALSRHPRLCYIHWIQCRLGTNPNHPDREYLMEAACEGVTLASSEMYLDDETSQGINAAHVAFQLLTGPQYLGAGFDPSYLDGDALEAWGVQAETEHIPYNKLITDGPTIEAELEAILQDYGVAMPYAEDLITFIVQRYSEDDIPELTDDHVIPPDLSRTVNRDPFPPNDIVFTFRNENLGFRTSDVPWTDDGDRSLAGQITAERSEITTVSHVDAASKIARRRSQEIYVQAGVSLAVQRGARKLVPGQSFIRNGQQFRVTGILPDFDKPEAKLDVSPDIYSVADVEDALTDIEVGGGVLPVAADLAVTFLELPPELTSETAIVVLRIRAHQQIAGANVYVAQSGEGYLFADEQNTPAQGGELEEAISAVTEDIIETGPRFEPLNDDMDSVLDLSGDTASWQSGSQIAVINEEVFFVESFDIVDETAWAASSAYIVGDFVKPLAGSTGLRYRATSVGGSGNSGGTEPDWPIEVGEQVVDGDITWEAHRFSYTPLNMIRARYGSVVAAHSINDTIFIADPTALTQIVSPVITVGVTLCVKTQPYTSSAEIDIASVTEVCAPIEGLTETDTIRVTADGDVRRTGIGDLRITQ